MKFILDKKTILDRLGGDEDIFAAMADMYLGDVENYCQELDAALASGQADVLQREAHTVKGLLATFADDDGAAMAMAIENQAKRGAMEGLEVAVAQLKERLHIVADGVRATQAG